MANPARETLSLNQLFALFHKEGDPGRWLSAADSTEFLNLVTWIVMRNKKELEGGLMLFRVIGAVVVAIIVGLVCMALLGPLLVAMNVPPATILGDFFEKYGWTLGILAGLWYFVSGSSWPRHA